MDKEACAADLHLRSFGAVNFSGDLDYAIPLRPGGVRSDCRPYGGMIEGSIPDAMGFFLRSV